MHLSFFKADRTVATSELDPSIASRYVERKHVAHVMSEHALKLPLKHSGGSGARHRKKSLRCEFMSTPHIPHLHASHHTYLICMHHTTHTSFACIIPHMRVTEGVPINNTLSHTSFACVIPHIPHWYASQRHASSSGLSTERQLDVCMRPLARVTAHASSCKNPYTTYVHAPKQHATLHP